MAINKKLIRFKTLTNFESNLAAGNILDTSIVFIEDAKKIWTQGSYYECGSKILTFASKEEFESELLKDNDIILPKREDFNSDSEFKLAYDSLFVIKKFINDSLVFIPTSGLIWFGGQYYGEGGTSMQEITHRELKALRDNSELIPGNLYRITDYVATVNPNNDSIRSAGHQFDIVVTALDEKTLSENASAVQHRGDTYFSNSNLGAWQIKYSIDNDASKYFWCAPDIEEVVAKWECSGGILETRNDDGAFSNYETVVVDGKTWYITKVDGYNPYLEDVTMFDFYTETSLGEVTSTNGFIYESDNCPYYDDGSESWIWDDVYEIRVKTSDGNLVATLTTDVYDGTFWDNDDMYDMMEYPIYFSTEFTEVSGVYHLVPESGINDWWEYFVGGSKQIYSYETYTGDRGELYYALETNNFNSNPSIYHLYSPGLSKLVTADTNPVHDSIDTIHYTPYSPESITGKGVIYRMIDEWSNSVPYDFKNIMTKDSENTSQYLYLFTYLDDYVKGVISDLSLNLSTWNSAYAKNTTIVDLTNSIDSVFISDRVQYNTFNNISSSRLNYLIILRNDIGYVSNCKMTGTGNDSLLYNKISTVDNVIVNGSFRYNLSTGRMKSCEFYGNVEQNCFAGDPGFSNVKLGKCMGNRFENVTNVEFIDSDGNYPDLWYSTMNTVGFVKLLADVTVGSSQILSFNLDHVYSPTDTTITINLPEELVDESRTWKYTISTNSSGEIKIFNLADLIQ